MQKHRTTLYAVIHDLPDGRFMIDRPREWSVESVGTAPPRFWHVKATDDARARDAMIALARLYREEGIGAGEG